MSSSSVVVQKRTEVGSAHEWLVDLDQYRAAGGPEASGWMIGKPGLYRTQDQVRILGVYESLKELLDSEGLATIGRMANSISHDVRALPHCGVHERSVHEQRFYRGVWT
jgi:hypothetical protein